jgi:hypothetical protein
LIYFQPSYLLQDLGNLSVPFPLLLVTDLARLTARAPIFAEQGMISMTPFYVDAEASTSRFFVVERCFANRTVVVETCSVLPLE